LYNQKEKSEFDESAIDKLRNGDITIFEKIFHSYFQQLFDFSNCFLHDEQESENIVQDVFFYLWTHKDKLKPNINIKAYLYRAVKNKSLNFKRHQKVEKEFAESHIFLPDTVEMPDERIHRLDIEKAIDKAIKKLPDKRRAIFCMHRFEKLTYKEIAKIQGISVKTVETQIKRSLLFLEKQLSRFLLSFFI